MAAIAATSKQGHTIGEGNGIVISISGLSIGEQSSGGR
jgi:hypothetical protein